jgi:hypothetical protein
VYYGVQHWCACMQVGIGNTHHRTPIDDNTFHSKVDKGPSCCIPEGADMSRPASGMPWPYLLWCHMSVHGQWVIRLMMHMHIDCHAYGLYTEFAECFKPSLHCFFCCLLLSSPFFSDHLTACESHVTIVWTLQCSASATGMLTCIIIFALGQSMIYPYCGARQRVNYVCLACVTTWFYKLLV